MLPDVTIVAACTEATRTAGYHATAGGGGTVPARLIQAGRAKNNKNLATCREADDQVIPMGLEAPGRSSPPARYVVQHGWRTLASASSRWTLTSARRWWTQRLSFALRRGNAQAVQGCLAGDEHRHLPRSRRRGSTVLSHLCPFKFRPLDLPRSRTSDPPPFPCKPNFAHLFCSAEASNRPSCQEITSLFVGTPVSRGGKGPQEAHACCPP
jgi:hypothetical protein